MYAVLLPRRCCTFCACVRGKGRTGKAARKVLAGGTSKALKASVLAAASAALAAGVYGITQVDRGLVDQGLTAIDTVPAFINTAVSAGQAAVASVQALDAQLLATQASMQSIASSDPTAAAALGPYISVGAGRASRLELGLRVCAVRLELAVAVWRSGRWQAMYTWVIGPPCQPGARISACPPAHTLLPTALHRNRCRPSTAP